MVATASCYCSSLSPQAPGDGSPRVRPTMAPGRGARVARGAGGGDRTWARMLRAVRGRAMGALPTRARMPGALPPRRSCAGWRSGHERPLGSGHPSIHATMVKLFNSQMQYLRCAVKTVEMCQTPLHVAAGYNNTELIKFLLIQQGAKTVDLEAKEHVWRDSSAYGSEEQFLRINISTP